MFLRIFNWIQNLIPKRSHSIKVPIIYYNKLNLNNRYYTPENLPDSLLNEGMKSIGFIPGQIGYPEDMDTSIIKMSHVFTKFYIKDDVLWGEGRTLKTKQGQKLNWLLLTGQVVFRPRSTGYTLDSGEVKVEKVFAIDAITRKEDAFALQVKRDEL